MKPRATAAENRTRATASRVVNSMPGTRPAEIAAAVLACRKDALAMVNRLSGGTAFIDLECGKKLCPSCMKAWSDRLVARVLPAAAEAGARNLRHMVLTIPNAPVGYLEEHTNALYAAFREWRNQGRRKAHGAFWSEVKGYAWKLEVDVSRTNRAAGTWHPHLHILLDAPVGFDFRRNSAARTAWCRTTTAQGLPANPGAQYITRPETPAIALEVMKYAAKPLQLSSLSDVTWPEAASTFDRRRVAQGYGSLSTVSEQSSGEWECAGRLSSLMARMAEPGPNGDFAAELVERFVSEHLKDDSFPIRFPSLADFYNQLKEQVHNDQPPF